MLFAGDRPGLRVLEDKHPPQDEHPQALGGLSPLNKPQANRLREMGMLIPVRALPLLLLAATAQAPCTWEGGPGCPDPPTPCVDWLGDTPAVCDLGLGSCSLSGANDQYCIASWVSEMSQFCRNSNRSVATWRASFASAVSPCATRRGGPCEWGGRAGA